MHPILTVEEALKILESYSCTQPKSVDSDEQKQQLQQALLLITDLSDYQNFGICADNPTQGLSALEAYLKALGYNHKFNTISPDSEPVYIKFNTKRMSHYLEPYTGEYRGVLVSCQSSENESINGTYGHLPINLFTSI